MGKENRFKSVKKPKGVLQNCVISFPALFKMTTTDMDDKEKYRATLIIDPDGDDMGMLLQLEDKVVDQMVDLGAEGNRIKSAIVDGNEVDNPRPETDDKIFIRATNPFSRPGTFDIDGSELEMEDGTIYAGCTVKAAISAYPWEFGKKYGVAFHLRGVKKVADGDPLAGEEKFDPSEFGDDEPKSSRSSRRRRNRKDDW